MKALLIFPVCIGLLLGCRTHPIKKLSEKPSAKFGNYKILRIDSVETVYLIYAQKNDSIFKIESKKGQKTDCSSLKVNEFYFLEITSVFLPGQFYTKMRVSGIKIDGVMISLEEDGIVKDLFQTRNLIGVCYKEQPDLVLNDNSNWSITLEF